MIKAALMCDVHYGLKSVQQQSNELKLGEIQLERCVQ